MPWSIVNVILRDAASVQGRNPVAKQVVERILRDGYEPFSTATFLADGIVVSFRRLEADGGATFSQTEYPEDYDYPEGHYL